MCINWKSPQSLLTEHDVGFRIKFCTVQAIQRPSEAVGAGGSRSLRVP